MLRHQPRGIVPGVKCQKPERQGGQLSIQISREFRRIDADRSANVKSASIRVNPRPFILATGSPQGWSSHTTVLGRTKQQRKELPVDLFSGRNRRKAGKQGIIGRGSYAVAEDIDNRAPTRAITLILVRAVH